MCRIAAFRLKDQSKNPPGRFWTILRAFDPNMVFERQDIAIFTDFSPAGVEVRTKWSRVSG